MNVDTLRGWCKQAEIDAGKRAGVTTTDTSRMKELERENRELKRANETSHAAWGQAAAGSGCRSGTGKATVSS